MLFRSKYAKTSASSLLVLALSSCSQPQEDGYTSSAPGTRPGTNTPGTNSNTASGQLEPDPNFDSAAYFEGTILPMFKAQCETCHVGPRIPADPRGPQTIYNETAMKTMLQEGQSAFNNTLILKVMAKTSHAGGDRCGGSIDNSPCKEIVKWWEGVFGKSAEGAVGLFGEFSEVALDGTVSGYAVDSADRAKIVTVELYVGGTFDQGGVKIGMINANKSGYDNNNGGTHMFQLKIPAEQITSGQASKVYGYTFDGETRNDLLNSPFDFTAYAPKAEATYNSAVGNILQADTACQGCHGPPSYTRWYGSLLNPPPHKGGSATNNNLYQKASGVNHPGGNRCGGGTLCQGIMQWWTAEFQ